MLPTLGIDNIIEVPSSTEYFKILHHQPINMPVITEAHKHDFFMLLMIEKGSGVHTIDFENYNVTDYCVFFLAPGQAHEWVLSAQTTGYQILFSADFLPRHHYEDPFFAPKSVPFLQIDQTCYNQLSVEIQQMERELQEDLDYGKEILENRLRIVLAWLRRWYIKTYASPLVKRSRLLEQFLDLLERDYKDNHDVGYYAESLHVTPNYLNTICKRVTGKTAGEQVRDRIILEIKRMLVLTDTGIKAIAFDLGFNDVSYFGRFFKKFTGQTPVAFRKKS